MSSPAASKNIPFLEPRYYEQNALDAKDDEVMRHLPTLYSVCFRDSNGRQTFVDFKMMRSEYLPRLRLEFIRVAYQSRFMKENGKLHLRKMPPYRCNKILAIRQSRCKGHS